MTTEHVQTFGETLRAARHGAVWYEPARAYVRVEVDENGEIRLDVYTPGTVPRGWGATARRHVVWWDDPTIFAGCRALLERSPFEPGSTATLYDDDDDGNAVRVAVR